MEIYKNLFSETEYIKISSITEQIINPFVVINTIIVRIDDSFFYLEDDLEKIEDVSKMPIYIKKDWLDHNKKRLSVAILNKQIYFYEKSVLLSHKSVDHNQLIENEEILILLKSIRRDFIIDQVL